MTIQERVVGSVTVLDLNGKLVLGDGDTLLKDKVHSLVFQGRKQIILNLGGVAYVDSSGLGALVASSVTGKKNGGQINLRSRTKGAPGPAVDREAPYGLRLLRQRGRGHQQLRRAADGLADHNSI